MAQIWTNARLATAGDKAGWSEIAAGAIAAEDGRIVFAGAQQDLPASLLSHARITDCSNRLITPSLIDCHTHLVYGGDRAAEFEQRLNGASYEQIARNGGGIVATVNATRALSVDDLVEQSLPRLDALLREGVSTIEIKSGYGLTIESELRLLRAARVLAERRPVRVMTTYLAAHAVPAEYRGRNQAYIAEVVLPGLRLAYDEGLVDAVDAFCERIAFSTEELRPLFDAARDLGLPIKMHTEQLSCSGGAAFAAAYGALSCEHLEYLDEAGARALSAANTVAVLLPGAFYALRETQAPPIALLRKSGVRMAISTDCNPGTSPLTSLLLAMNMSATLFGLTVQECLGGVTREAARALGILHQTGTLDVGKSADFTIWDVKAPAELVYRIGFNPMHQRILKGKEVS